MYSQMDDCLLTTLQGARPRDPVIHPLSNYVLRTSVSRA